MAKDIKIHAILSPSGAHRWVPCPGSVAAEAAERQDGVDDSSEASRLGTAAHALLELCLLFGFKPEEFQGQEVLDDHPVVDQRMCDGVQVALDYVEEYRSDHGYRETVLYVEEKLPAGEEIGVSDDVCSGTSDICLENKDGSMLTVVDYKNGREPVIAKDNLQLILYIAARRRAAGKKFKKYRGVIVQPNAGRRRSIEEWEITDSQLNKALEKIKPSAQIALTPNAPRNAGSHCGWCKAKIRCRTFKDKAMSIARVEFEPIEEESSDPQRLTNAEMKELIAFRPQLEKWLKAIEAYAMKQLQEGQRIPGLKLAWGKRTRQWDDEIGVVKFCKRNKLLEDDYSPRVLLSPAKMDTLLRRAKLIPRAKRGEDKPESPLKAFVKYSVPKLRVVSDDAETEFEEVEGDEDDEDDE